jgi:hypothetical protein
MTPSADGGGVGVGLGGAALPSDKTGQGVAAGWGGAAGVVAGEGVPGRFGAQPLTAKASNAFRTNRLDTGLESNEASSRRGAWEAGPVVPPRFS